MFADTLGNHDWMTSKGTTVSVGASHSFFGANHNNPKNGYESQENICYYFYYGDALFICLNTEEFTTAQYEWCEEVLKNSDAQYKFIFQHYQMFNKSGSFNSAGYTRWFKLCDKYGVDVAFSGNSHVYLRSQSIYDGKLNTDKTKGTVYMVAPSCDGDRGESPVPVTSNNELVAKTWADGLYQVANSIVNVRENYISVKLINKGGEILDTVTISPKRGVSSRITKDISGIDKKAFENSFKMSINGADLSKPYFNYAKEAFAAVKNVCIKDKDDNTIYYNGALEENRSRFKLDNFPEKQTKNLIIEITYWDNDVLVLEERFMNRKNFGSIDSFSVKELPSGELELSWKSTLKEEEVKELQLFVNGKNYKTLGISEKIVLIKLDELMENKNNEFILKLIDSEGNVIVDFNSEYYYKVEIKLDKIEIKVISKNDTIYVNDTVKLEAVKNPLDASDDIEWITSDESIASVLNGVITFKKAGKVTITVRSKDNKDIMDTMEFEAIEKEVNPDPKPNPDPTPDPNPQPSKSGCNSGSYQAIWYAISVLGLAFVLKKKNYK